MFFRPAAAAEIPNRMMGIAAIAETQETNGNAEAKSNPIVMLIKATTNYLAASNDDDREQTIKLTLAARGLRLLRR